MNLDILYARCEHSHHQRVAEACRKDMNGAARHLKTDSREVDRKLRLANIAHQRGFPLASARYFREMAALERQIASERELYSSEYYPALAGFRKASGEAFRAGSRTLALTLLGQNFGRMAFGA